MVNGSILLQVLRLRGGDDEDEEEVDPIETIGVVRCILAQTKEHEDWKRTSIL